MAVSTAQLGNISITTQVVQAGEGNVPGLATSSQRWTQKKKQPLKSLSAVIILIGALQLSIGVSMYMAEFNDPSILSRSGICFFGSLALICAGIITVIFANEESIIKIKICLLSHMINGSFAVVGMILYAVQLYTDTQACWVPVDDRYRSNKCNPGNSSTESPYDYGYHYRYYYGDSTTYVYKLHVSVNALVLSYVILGFLISNSIILMKWKSLKEAKYTLLGN